MKSKSYVCDAGGGEFANKAKLCEWWWLTKMDLFVTTLVFNYNGLYGGGMRCGVTAGVLTHGVGRRPAHLRRRVSNRPVITYRPLLIANNNNSINCIHHCSYITITSSQIPTDLYCRKIILERTDRSSCAYATANQCFPESQSSNCIVWCSTLEVCRSVDAWGNVKTITISFYC